VLWVDYEVGREACMVLVGEKMTGEDKEAYSVFIEARNKLFVDFIFKVEVVNGDVRCSSIGEFQGYGQGTSDVVTINAVFEGVNGTRRLPKGQMGSIRKDDGRGRYGRVLRKGFYTAFRICRYF